MTEDDEADMYWFLWWSSCSRAQQLNVIEVVRRVESGALTVHDA